jgi:hypothetical protein
MKSTSFHVVLATQGCKTIIAFGARHRRRTQCKQQWKSAKTLLRLGQDTAKGSNADSNGRLQRLCCFLGKTPQKAAMQTAMEGCKDFVAFRVRHRKKQYCSCNKHYDVEAAIEYPQCNAASFSTNTIVASQNSYVITLRVSIFATMWIAVFQIAAINHCRILLHQPQPVNPAP